MRPEKPVRKKSLLQDHVSIEQKGVPHVQPDNTEELSKLPNGAPTPSGAKVRLPRPFFNKGNAPTLS